MLPSEVVRMLMRWRFTGWMAILAGLLGAEPRNLVWQTGLLHIDPEV